MSTKVDTSDPHVRRLVYNMYRNILGTYNDKANVIVSTLPKERVCEDQGISRQLESMMQQSSQISGGSSPGTAIPGGSNGGSAPFPPPPPPMAPAGAIPSVRIPTEIGPAKKFTEPPAAIQNAMMTKDKKPFTYTPGGLDLAEIRSPRMARRINRNAHTEDSCTPPQQKPSPLAQQPQQPLPPAVVAAMQPQIAIPVFPPGAALAGPSVPPPPPPPPPVHATSPSAGPPLPPPPPLPSPGVIPPPPPPMQDQFSPIKAPPQAKPDFVSDIQKHPPLRQVNQAMPPRPDFVSEIPNHAPLRPVHFGARYIPQESTPPISNQVQLKPIIPKAHNITTPQESPLSKPMANLQISHPPSLENDQAPIQQEQALGSNKNIQESHSPRYQPLYIPPVEVSSPTPTTPKQTPPSPATLNKSPAPWMSTQKQVQKEIPPWVSRENQLKEETQREEKLLREEKPSPAPAQGHTRIIPIQVEGTENSNQHVQKVQTQQKQSTVSVKQESSQAQSRTRIIPIQIEGANDNRQNHQVQRQASLPAQSRGPTFSPNRFNPSPAPFPNSPVPGDMGEGRPRQFQTQQSWTQGNNTPIQSRSFRVLQKITGSDEHPQGILPPGQAFLMNRVFPRQEEIPAHQYLGGDMSPRSPQNMPPGQDNSATVPDEADYMYGGWYPNSNPTYPAPPYWYYPPQTPEEQQQFWEHYNAMCTYMAQMNAAAYRYSPYPMNPYMQQYPSDSEEGSGYSSTDEMTYYNNLYQQQSQLNNNYEKSQIQNESLAKNNVDYSQVTDKLMKTDSAETLKDNADESDSDTEVEDDQINGLQTIPSVPNINVYHDSSDSESQSSQSDESETSDDEISQEEVDVPHQLSVIYEESEHSSDIESIKKNISDCYDSEEESSTSTLDNFDDENNSESTVNVRLPLKLSFSRSGDDESVATVIVGELESSPIQEENKTDNSKIVRSDSDPDVSVTICLTKNRTLDNIVSAGKEYKSDETSSDSRSGSPIDFWKEINSSTENNLKIGNSIKIMENENQEENENHWEDDSSSASVQTVKKGESENENCSGSEIDELDDKQVINEQDMNAPEVPNSNNVNDYDHDESYGEDEDEDDEEEEEDDSIDEDESSESSSSDEDESKNSFISCQSSLQHDNTGNKMNKNSNTQDSLLPAESEEDDSGVTSDTSRHISETDTEPECGSELSKMSRCQRAATHSRLFKLLQEECGQDDDEIDSNDSLSTRKERLSLPLSNNNSSSDPDSLSSSSGINSPSSPTVNDQLVKELVQSLLSRKKGRHFRKLPIEKLHAAALRILQEDMEHYDTSSTSDDGNLFHSQPHHNKINRPNSVPVHEVPHPELYGGNYYDYCDYYNSWANAAACYHYDDGMCYDVVPSRTFRVLQDHVQSDGFDPGAVRGRLVRCPRVLSSKSLNTGLTNEAMLKFNIPILPPASPPTGT